MMPRIVDTNVPVVANGKSQQADEDCVLACIEVLEDIKLNGIIVIDDRMLILEEYMKNLSLSGQPGAGDLFMKWVWSVQADSSKCELVSVTPAQRDRTDLAEFPKDSALDGFDRSDRKFVAVALNSRHGPSIINAVDSDWRDHHSALTRHGVRIQFICPQHVCGPQQ
jgi:hypothetical protein